MFGLSTVLALLAPAAIAVSAQNASLPPRIRVSTRLVQVEVIVRDKNGPVADLTKDDFVVLDRGKPRTIDIFSVKRLESVPQTVQPLPPNTFSDLPQYATTPSSITVVLLDNLNTLYGPGLASYEMTPTWLEDHALASAKEHLIEFAKKLSPTDRVAVYGLGDSLHVLCDFTSDRDKLLAILDKYDPASKTQRETAQPGQFHIPNTHPAFSGFATASAKVNAGIVNQSRAQITMAAIVSIARHVENIPGRKNLVWLTADVPLSGEAIATAISNSDIAVYPVDARGLISFATERSTEDSERFANLVAHGSLYSANASSLTTASQPPGIEAMRDVADKTGGRAFANTNDITGAIRQAVEDSAVSYTLGFYINRDSADGKFHELKVEVKRKGVTIRYPKEYLAVEDAPATKDENRNNLVTATSSPIESSAISVRVRVERVEKPLPHCLSIFGLIDIHNVETLQSGGVRKGTLNVVTIEQDRSGQVVAQAGSTIGLHFGEKQYADHLKLGVPFHQYVQPKAEAITLRILVEDPSTAEVGSLIIPLSQIK